VGRGNDLGCDGGCFDVGGADVERVAERAAAACACFLRVGTSDVARRRRGTSDVFPPSRYWAESLQPHCGAMWLQPRIGRMNFSVTCRMQ
jgi:hypothetical protein